MVHVTLFEIHLDDAEFTANAPLSDGDAADADGRRFLPGGEDDDGAAAADEEGGPPILPAVAGLGLLLVLVLAARRLIGGVPEPLPE